MKDIQVSPYKTVKLSHRIYFFRSRGDLYASCSRNGIVTLMDADFNIKNVIDCSEVLKKKEDSIEVFTLHGFEDVFCIGGEYEFRVYDFSGKIVCSISEKVEAAYASESNNVAWTAKYVDNEHKKICLVVDNIETDSIILEDELFKSAVEFSALPQPDMVCMMFLAGQDGMMTYFLTNNDGKIICRRKEDLEDIAGMGFSDDNSKFLSVSAYNLDRISCYSYPSLELLREYELDEEQIEDEECQLGYGSFFIDNRYAVAEIGENLYYILDTDKMEVEASLIVEGHEPKPVPYYWPTLKNDEGETTNLSYFHKTKDYLISPFKAVPTDVDDNSLMVLRISDINEQIKKILL
ncbi:hypothetical protein D0T84_04275 [Dysgonomonas sp. 521]|uniref:hypothetical protein n=1 Tax=Dysgonomonas sp. 521 TaxID=2302932 RepID=UPI0013D8CEB5|nr:hypothetical protein [Dysgonomonas sp. 521]NDV94135.1 hypothetical protein [Dysgonomonas sp. 521]